MKLPPLFLNQKWSSQEFSVFIKIIVNFVWKSPPSPTSFPNLSNFCRNYLKYDFCRIFLYETPPSFFYLKNDLCRNFLFFSKVLCILYERPPLFVLLSLQVCRIFWYETPLLFLPRKWSLLEFSVFLKIFVNFEWKILHFLYSSNIITDFLFLYL